VATGAIDEAPADRQGSLARQGARDRDRPTYTIFAVSQRGAVNLAAKWKTVAKKA
jgi:hypothetical protein